MIKKIKLRDMTEEQFKIFKDKYCDYDVHCTNCPFYPAHCGISWLTHKDMYSDKFLDQEIEIEVTDIPTPVLTKEEHDYLEAVIKPFRDRVVFIRKTPDIDEYISLGVENEKGLQNRYFTFGYQTVFLPRFVTGEFYKGMGENRAYTLEELGL